MRENYNCIGRNRGESLGIALHKITAHKIGSKKEGKKVAIVPPNISVLQHLFHIPWTL